MKVTSVATENTNEKCTTPRSVRSTTNKLPCGGEIGYKFSVMHTTQVVTDLQTNCNRVVVKPIRMCSHCLFPVVVTSLEQVVITLLQG